MMGEWRTSVEVGPVRQEFIFLVVRNMRFKVLLGVPFLASIEATLTFARPELSAGRAFATLTCRGTTVDVSAPASVSPFLVACAEGIKCNDDPPPPTFGDPSSVASFPAHSPAPTHPSILLPVSVSLLLRLIDKFISHDSVSVHSPERYAYRRPCQQDRGIGHHHGKTYNQIVADLKRR
ncbi:hypothetical protein BCR44DRAFT_84242 [Catenaria anguillulae PL171]|uniref:Uncharacterized protein n=1 Tax=Catenaria anguillulae PL171 TaxID=765915 RepID=A0A1Y2HLP2_9FUNG|nr:hypothetical protein BCR44DRAFT_84242 [Catenaria anguillulae PL171]